MTDAAARSVTSAAAEADAAMANGGAVALGNVESPTTSASLSYSDASSAMSMTDDSFTSVASDDDIEAGDYMTDSRSSSNSSNFTEVRPHTQKKTVLVTGGAGFIGSWVADTLLARGDDVVIVDEVNDYYDVRTKRSNVSMLLEAYGPARVRFFEGDLCDAAFIENIFDIEEIEWVVHMAARAGVRPSIEDPFIYVHSNVLATTRLLELARLNEVKSFVFASSSSVYGGSPNEVFRETDVVDFPVSPYAATKKSCELMAHTYSHLYGLNVAALRFFTVYGPRGRPDMAPFKFIDLVCRGKEIMQFGDGSTSRDYTYISDIVDGVIRSLDRPAGYQIYNLGNGSPVSLSTFIKLVEESVGKPAKIKICPEQPGDVPRTCADITKARVMLGYNPTVSFTTGIRSTVKWYKERYGILDGDIVAKVECNPAVPKGSGKEGLLARIMSASACASSAEMFRAHGRDLHERKSRSMSTTANGTEFIALRNDGGGWDDDTMGRPRSRSKPGSSAEPVERLRRAVSVSYAF